jgi:hypothetical protein
MEQTSGSRCLLEGIKAAAIYHEQVIEAFWRSDVDEQRSQSLCLSIMVRSCTTDAVHIAAIGNPLSPFIAFEAVSPVDSGIGKVVGVAIARNLSVEVSIEFEVGEQRVVNSMCVRRISFTKHNRFFARHMNLPNLDSVGHVVDALA